jgi:peroxiredoxin
VSDALLETAGQRPAVFLIDPDGQIVTEWRGAQQWQIPTVEEIVRALPSERTHNDRAC